MKLETLQLIILIINCVTIVIGVFNQKNNIFTLVLLGLIFLGAIFNYYKEKNYKKIDITFFQGLNKKEDRFIAGDITRGEMGIVFSYAEQLFFRNCDAHGKRKALDLLEKEYGNKHFENEKE